MTDQPNKAAPAAKAGLDTSAEQALAIIRSAGRPAVEGLGAEEARRVSDANRALLRPDPVFVRRVEDRAFPSRDGTAIRLRLYSDLTDGEIEAGPPAGLVYFHGGGFTVGSIETHDTICREIARSSRVVVASVGYRLAPEHKFPCAVEDCIAALTYVARTGPSLGIDPQRLAVGGDSAGGNLAAVVALDARDRGGPALRAQVLVYPKTDHSNSDARYRDFPNGYRMNRDLLLFFEQQYLRGDADRMDWRSSPLLASDLGDLPTALVLTAGFDPLVHEGEAYALRLASCGVSVTLKRFPGQVHGFIGWGRVVPQASEAILDVSTFLIANLAKANV